MIQARYSRAWWLGMASIGITCIALPATIVALSDSFTWGGFVTVLLVCQWGGFGVMFLARSRTTVFVSSQGLEAKGLGAWRLQWHELSEVRRREHRVLLAPKPEALRRVSVRNAASWSRWFSSGGGPTNVITLPVTTLSSSARAAIEEHLTH